MTNKIKKEKKNKISVIDPDSFLRDSRIKILCKEWLGYIFWLRKGNINQE